MTTLHRVTPGPVRSLPVNPGEGLIRFPDTPPTAEETVAPPLPLDEVLQDFTGCSTMRKRHNLPWPKRIPGTMAGLLPEREKKEQDRPPITITEL